jgi:DNA transposition AAA+ family ATPase
MSDTNPFAYSGYCSWDEELRSWLENYILRHPHHTTTVLSRSYYIGVTRSVLNSYLAKKYFLPKSLGGEGMNPQTTNIEHAIRTYRERIEGNNRQGYSNTFVATRTWLRLKEACVVAESEKVIVVVQGKPGIGKSRGLIEYAVQEMVIAPVMILCSTNITPHFFAQMIARELGLDDRMSTANLENLIIDKLRRDPRSLFVDQANYLSHKALGTICYVWERARIPIVLAGTRALFDLFTSSRLKEDVRAQLASRVALHYLLPELEIGEVKAMVSRALGEDATNEVIAQIYNITGGVHRHVDMIVPRVLELKERNLDGLAKGEVSMKQIVTTAGSRLMAGV